MNLSYQISGPAHAPVIVLAHSLATNLSMWDRVAPLLDQDFRLLRFDFRGHGDSPSSASSCSIVDLQNDVLELLDALEISGAYFVGLSLGGMVGLSLALDRPDRLRGLVVCSAGAQTPFANRASWDDRIGEVSAQGVAAIVEPTLHRWFGETSWSDTATMDWMRAMVSSTSSQGYIGCARAVQTFDVQSRLPDMTVPALFIAGAQDSSASATMIGQIETITPGARLLTIENAGHLSAVDQPEVVASAITDFVQTLEQSNPANEPDNSVDRQRARPMANKKTEGELRWR